MKINKLTIKNFLGARDIDVDLSKPISLFAGKNYAGKSSIAEAVRLALTGESARSGLKKDYAKLVTEGHDAGFIEVMTAQDGVYSMALPSGKGTCLSDNTALPYVLDAQQFAALSPNDRRQFLFGLMGLSAAGPEVKKRLIAKNCDERLVDTIMPTLRSGFDAAQKEAQAKARDSKTEWRAVTGETYGEKKAASFKIEKPGIITVELAELRQNLTATDAALAAANQRIGSLLADKKRHAESMQRLNALREKAAKYARIAEKLLLDETGLKDWEVKVQTTRALAAGGHKPGLIHDLAYALNDIIIEAQPLGIDRPQYAAAVAAIDQYEAAHGPIVEPAQHDPEAALKLPEYEKALLLMQSTVANDRRDLADSDTAAKALSALEADSSAPDDAEVDVTRKHLDDLKSERATITAQMIKLEAAEREAAQADDRTKKALAAHDLVSAWSLIADALSPEGIPGDMLAEALQPINERLAVSAQITQWPCISITPDMNIFYGLGRPCELLSKSEKWRADAMIAEAVTNLSGIRILVLDGFDVLDFKGREDLICWLEDLAAEREIETCLLFGTLKALPASLPEAFESFWIESGVHGKLEAA